MPRDDPGSDKGMLRTRLDLACAALLLGVLGAVCLAAFFHLQIGSQAWDAHAQRAVVDRVDRLGGTFYTSGSDQKGPLWLAAYALVRDLSGPDTFWFATAATIIGLAAATAVLIGRIVRTLGASPSVQLGISVGAFTYLVLGPEEYSRVLYSRNLSTLCTAAAATWLLAAARATSTRAERRSGVAAGVAAGLAVQTMPTSALAVLVLLVWSAVASERRRLGPLPVLTWTFGSAAGLAFLSAFGWYAARGALHDFWQQWYGYNQIYTSATGADLGDQLLAGLRTFKDYYATHRVLAAGVLAYSVIAALRWRAADRAARAVLVLPLAWWAAECLSVTLSQRFFPHYFILPFTPAAVMLGAALGEATRHLPRPPRGAIAICAAVAVVVSTGRPAFEEGIEQAAAINLPQEIVVEQQRTMAADRQQVQAIAELFTEPDDFIYIWTKFPWRYSDARRSSASRYIENRWLTGEVYGGTTSARHVLPDAWSNLMDDLTEVRPPLVIEMLEEPFPVPLDSPLAPWLEDGYRVVYESARLRIHLDRDRFQSRFGSVPPLGDEAPWDLVESRGWSASAGRLRYDGSDTTTTSVDVALAAGPCLSLSMTLPLAPGPDEPIGAFVNAASAEPEADRVAIVLWAHAVVTDIVREGAPSDVDRVAAELSSTPVRIVARAGAFGAMVGDRFVAIAPRHHDRWALRVGAEPLVLEDVRYEDQPAHCR